MNDIFWKNKKVFITGHTGFKGSWLTMILLNMGAKVKGYSLPLNKENYLFGLIKGKISNEFIHLEEDILNKSFLKDQVQRFEPDIVFHMAAQALVRKSYFEPVLTWETNLLGSLNLLNSLKDIKKKCSVIIVTTDKVYKNKEWEFGYRENDALGGNDPYSASKAALEIAVDSWRKSFSGNGPMKNKNINIASVRAGNVIGGGDMAQDRIIPDAIRALKNSKPIKIRNPLSTRPWQHVLDPLSGYLLLAENLYRDPDNFSEAYNFGPSLDSNKTVLELSEKITKYWHGEIVNEKNKENLHEAKLLNLYTDKVFHKLNWKPKWDFERTVFKTIDWHKKFENGYDAYKISLEDINEYKKS